MDLRVPGGGSFLAALIDSFGRSANQGDDGTIAGASAQEVGEALGALFRGDIEYVGLNDEIAWIQTADTRGGYVFERSLDGQTVTSFPAVLSRDQVHAAFLAFLGGDVDCGLDWSHAAVVVEPKQKRRWFRR